MKATPGGCGIVEGSEKVEKSGRLRGSLEEKMKVKGQGQVVLLDLLGQPSDERR